MAGRHFEQQAKICKEVLDVLNKSIELDPENTSQYHEAIEYSDKIISVSNAIVKAYEVTAPKLKEERKEKDAAALAKAKEKEEVEKATKPRERKRKPKAEQALVEEKPNVTDAPGEESVEQDDDLFSMFE